MTTRGILEEEAVEVIFRRWVRHPKTGKVIRPKNGAKALVIRLKKRSKDNLAGQPVSSETNTGLTKA